MVKYQLLISMLAAAAFASPLSPELERSLNSIRARANDRDNVKDYKQICGHKLNDADPKLAAEIWRKTGAQSYLDTRLTSSPDSKTNPKPESYKNWVRKIDQGVFKKSQSDSWDCATLQGTCGHAADCKVFFDKGYPVDYWVMSAVSKAHSVFEYLHTQLTDNVLLNSLSLKELESDFGVNNPKVNPFGAASGAFGAASGFLGMARIAGAAAATNAGPAGGALGVISGAFGAMATGYKPTDPSAALESMLAQYYNQSKTSLEQTMRNLFGEGDPTALPKGGPDRKPRYHPLTCCTVLQ